jgi:hypothetical protein
MKKTELEVIGKRLLPYLPGFKVKGDMLFIQPIGHTLRAIVFDRSIASRSFYVQVLLEPLFVPTNVIGFNVGWRVGRSWSADAPNIIAELGAALEREALPFLSVVNAPLDVACAATALDKPQDPHVQQAIAYSLARAGDAEHATVALNQLVHLLDTPTKYAWQTEMADRALALNAKIISDPMSAQRQLKSWEDESARNLGLEEFR